MSHLPSHLQRMVLFMLNTGARDENVCGLRWEWEVAVPEVQRSVFVIPAAEFKSKRAHVLILNDVAWRVSRNAGEPIRGSSSSTAGSARCMSIAHPP